MFPITATLYQRLVVGQRFEEPSDTACNEFVQQQEENEASSEFGIASRAMTRVGIEQWKTTMGVAGVKHVRSATSESPHLEGLRHTCRARMSATLHDGEMCCDLWQAML